MHHNVQHDFFMITQSEFKLKNEKILKIILQCVHSFCTPSKFTAVKNFRTIITNKFLIVRNCKTKTLRRRTPEGDLVKIG